MGKFVENLLFIKIVTPAFVMSVTNFQGGSIKGWDMEII